MHITIRNERLLRWLGFERAPGCTSGFVGLSAGAWLDVIYGRLSGSARNIDSLQERDRIVAEVTKRISEAASYARMHNKAQ